mgnify:CR=1 FL=1
MGRNVFQCSAVNSSLVMESLLVAFSSPVGLEGLKSITGSFGCFSGVETLKLKDIPRPDDAADALAIAICHARSATSLLRRTNPGVKETV